MRGLSAIGAALAAVGALVIGLAACGEADTAAPLTAEQLAAALVTPDDFDGTWTRHVAPDEAAIDGVVSDAQQELLPRVDLCDQASQAARDTTNGIEWKAFRQLDLTVDNPLDPPDRSGHIVFAQEFLTSGDLDTITATFDQFRVGMDACLGDFPAGDEGPSTAATMLLPSLGDDRFAVLTVIQESGMGEAGGWAEWRLHQMVVRDGSTLLGLLVVEIRSNDVEPLFTADDVGAMARTALDHL